MSSILDLLNSDLGKTLINGASQRTGQPADKTTNLLSQAMPLILGAMQRNASTPEGATALNNALGNPKHSGGILDTLGGVFGNGTGSPDDLAQDGAGILGHVLGSKQPQIQNALSQSSGIDANSVGEILKMAAPIIMGLLGKQKQSSGIDQNGIGELISSVLGQGSGPSNQDQSFIEKILDADGDGSIIDDVADMALGGKKKGGLGGLLGGLLGGR